MKILLCYFLAISLIAVVICVFDKKAAKKGWRRVNEMVLLGASFMGGSIAMYITMRIIHHKTRHIKFMLGIPIMIALQVIGIVVITKFL